MKRLNTPIQLLKIGADIEVFLRDKNNQEIVSAEGLIPGTKNSPFIFDNSNKYFSISLDNVLAEFTIPPASSAEDFYNYIQKGLNYINSSIPTELCTAAIPSAVLDTRFLLTENAQTFGCDPDYNAYTQDINPRPAAPDFRLRSGGGHIHISYKNPTPYTEYNYKINDERPLIVKALDLFIGVPFILIEPDNDRKSLYGKAGAFRPKPYGVEYRTLSNHYINDEILIKKVYNSVERAIDFLNNNEIQADVEELIIESINNNNKKTAEELVNTFNLL